MTTSSATRYALLLRGVNVGAVHLGMTDPPTVPTDAGSAEVRTVSANDNVLLGSAG